MYRRYDICNNILELNGMWELEKKLGALEKDFNTRLIENEEENHAFL